MSYHAKVFKVMIASPGDVAEERNVIREVIHEWNIIHSETRKIVLLPVGWDTHSSPELGERPQAIINKQVLETCDVLVGVFWTRIGTNTGIYPSGTVEEIEMHLKLGKPAMLYFSNQPVHPDRIDYQQYSRLKEFKEGCESRGLCETYDDIDEFQNKFSRQLQLKINQDETFIHLSAEEVDSQAKELHVSPAPLSEEARILLKETSLDPNGMILHAQYLSGSELETNGKNFLADQSRRNIATWEAALEELVSSGLLIDKGHNGEVFEITDKGYQVADTIEP